MHAPLFCAHPGIRGTEIFAGGETPKYTMLWFSLFFPVDVRCVIIYITGHVCINCQKKKITSIGVKQLTRGPKINPCWTPKRSSFHELLWNSILGHYFLLMKYSKFKCTAEASNPYMHLTLLPITHVKGSYKLSKGHLSKHLTPILRHWFDFSGSLTMHCWARKPFLNTQCCIESIYSVYIYIIRKPLTGLAAH